VSSLFRTESIASIFRQISQKRKNGVIELIGTGEPITVGFNQGKVVFAYQGAISFEEAIISLLKDQGSLEAEFDSTEIKTLEQIAEKLEGTLGEVSRDILRKAAKKIILDTLFNAKLEGKGHYSFRVQGVDYDASFIQPFTVGQVLLDSATYMQAEEKFKVVFKAHDKVRSKEGNIEELSEAESNLFKICSCIQDIDKLSSKILLHALEIKEGLVVLNEKGLIEINPQEEISAKPTHVPAVEKNKEEPKPEKKIEKERVSLSAKIKIFKLALPKLLTITSVPKKEIKEEVSDESFDFITAGTFTFLLLGIVLPICLWFNILSSF